MQIDERSIGSVMILDLKGKITLNEGDEVLKDKINSLILQGQPSGRPAQAGEPDQAHYRPADDHQAAHGLRDVRQRSGRAEELLVSAYATGIGLRAYSYAGSARPHGG